VTTSQNLVQVKLRPAVDHRGCNMRRMITEISTGGTKTRVTVRAESGPPSFCMFVTAQLQRGFLRSVCTGAVAAGAMKAVNTLGSGMSLESGSVLLCLIWNQGG
jgi:hypothetical protein